MNQEVSYNLIEENTIWILMEPIFLRIQDVIKMTSLSRSTIYRMINDREFPEQILVGTRQVRWHRQEILDWCEEKLINSR